MIVEGFFNATDVIQVFLAREYGFSIKYPKHEIRIGHTKGTWYCAKLKNEKVVDFISINDSFTQAASHNDLTLAVYEELRDSALETEKEITPGDNRRREADVIERFLRIWAGKPELVEKISVIQPHRNVFVDEFSGDFQL